MAKSDMAESSDELPSANNTNNSTNNGRKSLEANIKVGKRKMRHRARNSENAGAAASATTALTDRSAAGNHMLSSPSRISTPISILIESLVKNICTIYETDAKKATAMYNIICDKLFKMNMIDESYHMNEFEGMRNQYQRAFLHLLSSTMGNDSKIPLRPIWPGADVSNSHYLREFDEVEYIAGGGFGQVYRVRHKLDGIEYAIKKIPIRSEGIDSVRNYLSEVKTFSSINHTNIVQYKAAWLELGPPTSSDRAIMHDFSHSTTFSSTTSISEDGHNKCMATSHIDEYIYHKTDQYSFSEQREEDTDFEVDFEHSISNNTSKKKPTTHLVRRGKRERRESVSEGGQVVCKLDLKELKKMRSQQRTEAKWATLYIQMALCQSTLKQWLEKRNEMHVEQSPLALIPVNGQIIGNNAVFEILAQLLKGLEYIHSKGIVHHDIKPSNIFIQKENDGILVQLGDFGLACPLQSVRHSLAFGTKLYAAPEQLAGKCDPKSDMYSVGIVLFELVEHFRTDMERVENINELRKGHLAAKIIKDQPQLAQIITQLTSRNPENRPSASTLLKRIEVKSTEVQQIEQLKMKLAEKDEEILQLRELLKSHGIKSV